MPSYTFINKLTNKKYDKIMSYEELIEYLKDSDIEQEYKVNTLNVLIIVVRKTKL